MPSFDTPGPISASVELVAGDVRINAGPRSDTVVHVRPADESEDRDVRAAAETRVDYAAGRLVVRGPKHGFGIFGGKSGTVEVTIDLPAGSGVEGKLGVGAIRCTGTLADCRLKTGFGDLQVEDTGRLDLDTGFGAAIAENVAGDADITTGSGRLSVRTVAGRAVLKNGNGDIWIDETAGDLRVHSANGHIAAEHAAASVTANTANGDIRVGELVRGSATLRTAAGRIEVGIKPGTAARLDLHTHYGKVRNEMDAAAGPADTDEKAEVRARTAFGDILIHRS
ncbi:DUF4097 family beta strand repeat-containing protein [Micromonospora sp. WMMD812]|uniref:DUF4097 family beta strand repeat-containing protein n=1 Tax=Micromonospora sp. WMMD812 TaxID=3015152 RepID=UPI00248B5D41|nr:DUF4097 family beta strand repeat-containing protein [Micromonospora sp. WMMD812]WBB68414.1 DUF4097 family beta strand repeat-containing protein [Micromonospora sp. WMMD812]